MPTVGGYNIPAADKEAIEELKRLRNNWEFILAPGAPPVSVYSFITPVEWLANENG